MDKAVDHVDRKRWYKCITVEPTMFLYMMAFMVTSVVENVFFNYKSCTVNNGFSHEICMELEKYNETKAIVQATTADFLQYNSIAGHVIPIVMALFLGSFSDRRGRKLPLLMGLIGKFIYSSMIVVNTLMTDWPVEYIIYTASIPSAFTGADVAVFACAFSYISDVTSTADRTLRITILDVCYLSTMPTGVYLGTLLFNYFNKSFTKMFIINASLLLLSIVYTLINLEWQTSDKQRPLTELPANKWFADFFDKKHLVKSYETITKKRDNNHRRFLILVMIAMALYAFQRDEKPYLYLYTQLKLNWKLEIYSNFKTFQSASFVLVMLIAVPIFNRVLKFKDTIICAIGACAHSLGRVIFAFANSTLMFYFGAVVASFGPIVAPALRSITSKLVPAEERGTTFSLLSVCDNAVPLVSGILYTQIYKNTLKIYPASIFWLTITTQVIVLTFVCYIHYRRKKNAERINVDVLIEQQNLETKESS